MPRRCFVIPLMISPFLLGSSQAAILQQMDELKTLELPIAQNDMTRISVKGDRISGVYGAAGVYSLEADEEQGQVFLRPNRESNLKAIHLNITTERGLSQDLRLVLKDISPESIILKRKEEASIEASSEDTLSLKRQVNHHSTNSERPQNISISREEVLSLIDALRDGSIPIGYHKMSVDIRNQEEGHPLIRELSNGKLQGFVLEVENKTKNPLFLREPSFGSHSKTIAVSINNKHLQPGERAEVYVVRSH